MKSALGRGLGELLGEIDTVYDKENHSVSENIEEIDVNLIIPNPNQPRTIFNESEIKELSKSIEEHGLLQPINVTRDGSNYIVIAGERRLRAVKMANIPTIRAIILNVDDSKLAELAIIENIQRADLNIVELAKSYLKLLNNYNLTHDELAKKVSKSRSSITNTLRLLNLSQYVQDKLSLNAITLGHAKIMIGLKEEEQDEITDLIISKKLNVRDTENIIKNKKDLKGKSKKDLKIKLDTKILDKVIEVFKSKNIKASVENNSLKINFSSQEELEIIYKYFL
jgi:ParB family transcriptional regulator, chromosome partitioning protein